jgi:hypothetical protein
VIGPEDGMTAWWEKTQDIEEWKAASRRPRLLKRCSAV